MQKKIIIGAVVIVLLLICGAIYYKTNSAKTAYTNPTNANTSANTMADSISKAGTVSCNYTDEKGRTFKTSVKNGKIRSDIDSPTTKESGSMIIVDNKMYFWSKQMAYVMEIPDSMSKQAADAESNQENKRDEMMKQIDQYRQYCKAATISDDVFVPPADVKFQDYSTVQQSQSGAAGAGSGAAGGVTQEQMKQYMQQYQKPQQ